MHRVGRLLVCCAIAGCGRIDFDPAGDASTTSTPMCDPTTPFGPPVSIDDVNSSSYDSSFAPTDDELTAYFYSLRTGNADLYVANRADLGSPWSVTPLSGLNTAGDDREPAPSPDGSLLVFISNRAPTIGGLDLWYATFDGTTYSVGGPLTSLSSTADEYHPMFQIGSQEMWFASTRGDGTGSLFHTTRTGTATFSAPVQVTELDVPGADLVDATVSPDGLTVYFASNRSDGHGGYDIWRAQRATTADLWGAPTNLDELDSTQNDYPNWISSDGCRLYMHSNRADPSQIYVATRSP